MGCWYSRENRCFSLSCCFCIEPKSACYWIGAVGLVWGGFATNVDFISAYLPRQSCTKCLDYEFHSNMCFASGWINAVQWLVSIMLIHGARKGLRWLVLLWLGWSLVSLAMLATWIAITLPYFPSMRTFFSLIQLVWGIHYYIVVKTHYSMLTLSFNPPEEHLCPVPPNSPSRKHKRRKRRLDKGAQPPVRTLLGVAVKLQHRLGNAQRPEVIDREDEPEVIVVSGEGGPEVGHATGEAMSEGHGATGPLRRPEVSGPDEDGGREIRHQRPGEGRRSRNESEERRRRRRRRRRREERRRRKDQEEIEGSGGRRRRRRRKEDAGEAASSTTQPDSFQASPLPEGEHRIPVVQEGVSYQSRYSIVLCADPSKAEGIARSAVPFTRVSSASAGPSGDPSASAGPSEDPSASAGPSGYPSASAGPSEDPSASAGPSGDPSASAGPSEDLSASAGPSGDPSASAGPSGDPSASAVVREEEIEKLDDSEECLGGGGMSERIESGGGGGGGGGGGLASHLRSESPNKNGS